MKHSIVLLLISFVLAVPCHAQTNQQEAIKATPDSLVVPLKPPLKEKMTYGKLWKATRTKTVNFFKRCKPTAENLQLNWEDTKKMVRSSGPYLSPVASATGILFNINNYRIRGN